MVYDTRIIGKNIILRSVDRTDAEFLLQLRLDPRLGCYIGKTSSSLEEQRQWIQSQREREGDFYFIIEDIDGQRRGSIALYNIDMKEREAEWGRWVIAPGSSLYVAIESMILIYYFAFKRLNLNRVVNGTQNENTHVIFFHKQYAKILHSSEKETWFYVTKSDFPFFAVKFPGITGDEIFDERE